MIPEILQKDAPALRKKALEVPIAEIKSAKIQKMLTSMADALYTQDDGVALAAPQIGVSLRIFIVAKAALNKSSLKNRALHSDSEEMSNEQPPKATRFSKGDSPKETGHLTFINPIITKLSKDKALLDEGCLSVRPLYGKIKRSKKATIRAYDENGKLFERGASGLLAQIFQHEVDHLNGALFIDKAVDVKEMPAKDELGSRK